MNLLPSVYITQPIVWRSRLTYASTKAQEEAVVLTGMAFSRDRLSFRKDEPHDECAEQCLLLHTDSGTLAGMMWHQR
jgi:hypothetical protein